MGFYPASRNVQVERSKVVADSGANDTTRRRSNYQRVTIYAIMWKEWANGILGLAVLALAFVGLTGMALAWTLGVIGAVIAILSFWDASEQSSMNHGRMAMR
jgi:hypothetical protein